jgi:hypothetical protein
MSKWMDILFWIISGMGKNQGNSCLLMPSAYRTTIPKTYALTKLLVSRSDHIACMSSCCKNVRMFALAVLSYTVVYMS